MPSLLLCKAPTSEDEMQMSAPREKARHAQARATIAEVLGVLFGMLVRL